jgi:hypothetical protein
MNNIAAIVRAFGLEARPSRCGIQLFEDELRDPAAGGVGLQATLGKNQGRVVKRRASRGFFLGLRDSCCATYFGEGEVGVVGGGEGDITLESREIICCGVGSPEASQPPPSASISCTLAVIC